MRILVTGSNGFIGNYVGQTLAQSGHEVLGIDIASAAQDVFAGYYPVDITSKTDMESLSDTLGTLDAVVHCAAHINYDDTDSRLMQVNAVGTQNVVTLGKWVGCKRIIYCSSIAVIGIPKILPITEEHPLAPQTMYHVSKLAGEYIVQASGIPHTILRIPSPIGLGMNLRTILPAFVSRCVNGEDLILLGQGTRKQNYIAVQDISRAVRMALEGVHTNCYNLSSRLISNYDLACLCKTITHSCSVIAFSEQADPAEGQVWDISSELIRQELGFEPQIELESVIAELQKSLERG